MAKNLVMNQQGHAQGSPGVPRGRLNPEPFKRALSQNTTVTDAIQGNSSGQAQILHPGFPVNVPCHPQHDFLGNHLD